MSSQYSCFSCIPCRNLKHKISRKSNCFKGLHSLKNRFIKSSFVRSLRRNNRRDVSVRLETYPETTSNGSVSYTQYAPQLSSPYQDFYSSPSSPSLPPLLPLAPPLALPLPPLPLPLPPLPLPPPSTPPHTQIQTTSVRNPRAVPAASREVWRIAIRRRDMNNGEGPSANVNNNAEPSSSTNQGVRPSINVNNDPVSSSNANHDARPSTNVNHAAGPFSNVNHAAGPSSNLNHGAEPSSNVNHNAGASTNVNYTEGPSSNVNHGAGPSTNVNYSRGPSSNVNHSAGPSSNANYILGPSDAATDLIVHPNDVSPYWSSDDCEYDDDDELFYTPEPNTRQQKNTSRYTGSRYRSANKNKVRMYSFFPRFNKPSSSYYIDAEAHQQTMPEYTDFREIGRQIVNSSRDRFDVRIRKFLDHQELYFENYDDNWEVVGELGSGANGTVFSVKSKRSGETASYAVKRLIVSPYSQYNSTHRTVLSEVYVMKSKHPNIVPLKYGFFYNNVLSVFMEQQVCCVFDVLDKVSRNRKRGLDEGQSNYIAHEVMKGLHYMHKSLGFFHGDIKSENILIGHRGEVKLADFGLSKPAYVDWEGSNLGTPDYMAPELKDPNRKFNEQSDIWSLGRLIDFMVNTACYNPESTRLFHKNREVSNTLKSIVKSTMYHFGEDRPTITQLLDIFKRHFSNGTLPLETKENMNTYIRQL